LPLQTQYHNCWYGRKCTRTFANTVVKLRCHNHRWGHWQPCIA